MIPIGTKVRVASVDHLRKAPHYLSKRRLIGRTGAVIGHLEDGANEVAHVPAPPVTWVFYDDQVEII